jgi:hypothetical protein
MFSTPSGISGTVRISSASALISPTCPTLSMEISSSLSLPPSIDTSYSNLDTPNSSERPSKIELELTTFLESSRIPSRTLEHSSGTKSIKPPREKFWKRRKLNLNTSKILLEIKLGLWDTSPLLTSKSLKLLTTLRLFTPMST